MARLIATIVLFASLAPTAVVYAEEQPTDDTIALAEEGNVDALDLQGVRNTLHLESTEQAREYLYVVGSLQRPAPPPPAIGIWDQLAECESHGNWAANTGNRYYGGIQFDLSSWEKAWRLAYGPKSAPTGRPDQVGRTTQIEVGQAWRNAVGWSWGWPACSRRLGLR